MSLIKAPNLDRPDDVYEALVRALDGLAPEAALRVSSRLVLLLANSAMVGTSALVEADLLPEHLLRGHIG